MLEHLKSSLDLQLRQFQRAGFYKPAGLFMLGPQPHRHGF